MTDIYTKDKRSKIMSNIGSVSTKPEIIIRKSLFSKGFRYRIKERRSWFAPVLFKKQGNYFISTKALVPNYEESLINGFLLMGISIKAA